MKIAAAAALATLVTAGAAGSASADTTGVQVTPGYDSQVYTNESTTVWYSGCGTDDATADADFVLFFSPEDTVYLGSGGSNGSFTFSYPTPGRYKVIVHCFVDEVDDSSAFAYIDVLERPAAPIEEPTSGSEGTPASTATTIVAAPTSAPTSAPAATPAAAAAPAATAAAASPASASTPVSASKPTSTVAAPSLPATGANSTTLLAAVAAATLAVGESLRRVVRRPARAEG